VVVLVEPSETSENQLRSIEIGPSPTGAGLLYEACPGCLTTTIVGKELDFAYTVTVLNPSLKIIQASLELIHFEFEGSSGSISIIEEVSQTTESIGTLQVIVDADGDPNILNDDLAISGLA